MKLKIALFFITTGLLTFFGISLALDVEELNQDSVALNIEETSKGKIINDIDLFFCNEGFEKDQLQDNINTALKQLEEKEICIAINNKGSRDAEVKVVFNNGILDSLGAKSCTAKPNDSFNQFIEKDFDTVPVPANSYVVRYFTIKAPLGLKGIQNGCLGYSAITDTKNSINPASMVSMVVRKIRLIDFFIGDVEDIENKIEVNSITKEVDSNGKLKLSFFVKNIGNIDSFTEIKGEITNMLGFTQSFSLSGYEINSTETVVVVGEIGPLPSYKGLFNIELNLLTTPKFDFDISEFEIDEEILKGEKTKVSTTLFIIPRLVIGLTILIIFLLFIAFKKKKPQVVYVQQPQ